jgi:predicted nucleotidyltransferase
MNFATALDPILDSVTKLRVLRKLFVTPYRKWTGRELARAAGVSTAQTARDLRDLEDGAVVIRETHGRAYSWYLNRENALFPQLLQLFQHEANLRSELIHQIGAEFRSEPIERARIFGSVARGEEQSGSDIDLFVEVRTEAQRPRVDDALERIRARVWREFGSPISPLVYTESKLRRPPNPALIAAIDRDGIEVPHDPTGG